MQQEWRNDDYTRDRLDDPAAKRPRYETTSAQYGNGHAYPSQQPVQQAGGRGDASFEDRANPQPSPVVHIRSVPETATDNEIMDAASKYGAVRCVFGIQKKRMALVEFVDMNDAIRLVKSQGLNIAGVDTQVNYSTSQKINKPEDPPKNILLMTVLNARYPIDVEVIHKISQPHGQVIRIVIFRKAGQVQAMVEFDSVDSAVRAKSYLNGADIYSGCCTLKIEFAKIATQTLTVVRNDKDTWDYTRESLGEPARPPPLLEKPADMPPGHYGDPYGNRGYQPAPAYDQRAPYGDQSRPTSYDQYQRPAQPVAQGAYDRGGYDRRTPPPHGQSYPPVDPRGREYERGGAPPPQYDSYGSRQERRDQYGGPRDDRYDSRSGGGGRYEERGPQSGTRYGQPGGAQESSGAVVMLYGLNMDKFNCDRLFNLFCMYGNVMRVKFLKSKEGSAMIQMGDTISMRRAIENLHGITAFGSKIQVTQSRQPSLNDVPNPYTLPDGTPSYKDYSNARNNRFSTPEQAAKNRITAPTKCLHFFNAPAGSDEAEVEDVFVRTTGRKPDTLIMMKGKSERSESGFVEYETLEAAVEALVQVNHTELPNKSTQKGAFPYIFKVCFTTPNVHTARREGGGAMGVAGGGHPGSNGSQSSSHPPRRNT
ncbi:heterogeneous nuclear ribonucleoprotein L-like [Paramacrobiotus metropolitanus]|uniref:heterogeneous nuclear ribonucleoprotein L-like n=1 Tax=Paramacrobiotus metropolitanus TaxID=2943436 RepID=UPI0024458945|nr:heterogeneous nuclear ribonucleoprotein L-like [Paramacrobiotus metropolitanus]